jgi:hypothetical protein
MATPVEGIQGQGLAGVWHNTPDFWRMAAGQRQDQAAAQRALENEKKLRDQLIDENRKFAPDKVWEPFYAEVQDHAHENVQRFTLDNLAARVPPNQFEAERLRRIGENKKLVNKINYYKDIHETMSKKISDDKNLVPQYYDSKLNDYFFNGRQAKHSDDINVDGIENIFNDSKGYNMSAVASSFMKDLPQQLTEKYRKISSDLGEQFDISTIKSKLGVETNSDGSVRLDPRTGLPQIKLTDDVTMSALDNPYLRNYVIDNLGADAMKPHADLEPVKKLLAPILTPYDQRAIQSEHRNGFKYTEDDKSARSGYSVPEANVAERYDTLYRITHEHDPELLASLLPGLEDVNVGYQIFAPGESKKAPPRIVLSYPNKQFDKNAIATDNESDPKARDANPKVRTKTLSLQTEEDRQAAMEFLNTMLDDKLPTKQKIGENLTNYRKRKRKEQSDQGNVYSEDAQSTPGSGGIY